ncbi:MAG TPA: hypothetical protein VIE16_07025 [Phenylobacterium sp.]
MKSYRVYIVGFDGRLQLGQAFDAPNDADAGRRAETLADRGLTAELWEGGRLVGTVSRDGAFSLNDS